MSTIPSITRTPKRRWLQFSLRTLLVVMLIVAIGCGVLAIRLEKARRQREAVVALRALGRRVLVVYDEHVR